MNNVGVSTLRTGNTIGGGDFAEGRLIPDCIRAAINQQEIVVKNPHSIRLYQYVLEAVSACLFIAMKQYDDITLANNYSVEPNPFDSMTTEQLVQLFCDKWDNNIKWRRYEDNLENADGTPTEDDPNKQRLDIGWKSPLKIQQAIDKTIEWTKAYINNQDVSNVMDKQIEEFIHMLNED